MGACLLAHLARIVKHSGAAIEPLRHDDKGLPKRLLEHRGPSLRIGQPFISAIRLTISI